MHNYAAVANLDDFLDKIVDNASQFSIISASERRCYNIMARFLPSLNIISNNALLLMYKEFAQYYIETGIFLKR